MKRHKAKESQNIIDLAIQEYGSVDGILNIIADNDDIANIDAKFTFQQEILIDNDTPIDENVRDYFSNRETLFVSTGNSDDETIVGDYNNDFNNDFDIR